MYCAGLMLYIVTVVENRDTMHKYYTVFVAAADTAICVECLAVWFKSKIHANQVDGVRQ